MLFVSALWKKCVAKSDGWMSLGFYVPFNSISVISGRWKGEHERLCVMKCCLCSGRISPQAGTRDPVIRSWDRSEAKAEAYYITIIQ